MAGNGNGRARALQFAAAIIGTVLISILGAFFAFGSSQADSIQRLEQSENEDARQRQVDQATIRALSMAIQAATVKLAELETRIAVLEAKIDALQP